MGSKKIFYLFLLLLTCICIHAQNINGFIIPVAKDEATSIAFHSDITSINFTEKSPPYKTPTLGPKAIMIQTSQDVNQPYNLFVTEGGRRHRFVIVSKNNIDISEQDYDYSDLKQLSQQIKEFGSKQQTSQTEQPAQNNSGNNPNNQPVNTQKNNNNNQPVSNQNNNTVASSVNTNNDNFYVLMDAGDKAKSNNQLDEAKAEYQQALQLKPGNPYAQNALNEVNKLIESLSAAKFQDIITKANTASNVNSYDEAIKYYNDALAIKPNDAYAASQIILIQKKQEAAKNEESNRQRDISFKDYISAGDKALAEKSYDAAAISYNEALKIKPDNTDARLKLNNVRLQQVADSMSIVNKRNNDAYTSFINNGNKAMQEKSYNEARLAYLEALKYKPNDAAANSKLISIDQQKLTDSLLAVRDRNQNLYSGYIKAGDLALKDSLFDAAKSDYNEALKIYPDNTYAKDQIKKIDDAAAKLLKQEQQYLEVQKNKERQDEYNSLKLSGDNYYNSGMYAEAKDLYIQALALNNKDQYLKNKITQTNNLIALQKDKRKQDSLNDISYTASILKADSYFNNEDYPNAKKSYSLALKYKADDMYAKDRLAQIDADVQGNAAKKQAVKDSIAKANESNKKYNDLITKANAAYNKKDLVMARGFYASANAVKPGEQEPVNKIAAIDDTLNMNAKNKLMQGMSDSLVTIAEIAIADSDYNGALKNLADALTLNPSDPGYINKQIAYVQKQVVVKDSLSNQKKTTEEHEKELNDLIMIYDKGKNALKFVISNSALYDTALAYFSQFLSGAENLGFTSTKYDLDTRITFAKDRIAGIKNYQERQKNMPKDTSIHKLPDVKNLPEIAVLTYYNPKDPKLESIYKKYPDINFNASPDNQRFDSISDYSIENKLISKNVMSAATKVIAENTNNSIKVTCQNIIIIGQKLYVKLMVQNNSPQEFLTGNMLLTQNMQDGSAVKLLPNYVAGYPIILANQQKVIVYVTKSRAISDNDKLDFEVADRLNQTKITVTVSGNIYNQEKKTLHE